MARLVLWGPRCVHPLAMRLNSSSAVCLCSHSSTDTYFHRPIFVVRCFGWGYWGFFVVFFVDVDAWGEHGGTTVAVGDGVFALPALDVVVFFITTSEENGGIWVGGVAGGLMGIRANSTLFFSCHMYTLNKKSSAHNSTTILQNGGSACAVLADVSR
jgi:hypothetical protein